MTVDPILLEVPTLFWNDHDEREMVLHSGAGYIVKRTQRFVTVALHPRDAADLLSDARFNSDTGDSGQSKAMIRAAKATVTAIIEKYSAEERREWKSRGTCDLEGWCPICGNDKGR